MRPDPAEAMAAAVHDVRGSVGSIRLALTSVLDEIDDDDVEFRRSMLSGAEMECRRLNASLTALPALVAAGVDSAQPEGVDLVAALEAARDEAARRQVTVRIDASAPVWVSARSASIAQGLAAVCAVVADDAAGVVVTVTENDLRGRVTVAREDSGPVRWDRAILRGLADSLGADLTGDADRLELAFPLT